MSVEWPKYFLNCFKELHSNYIVVVAIRLYNTRVGVRMDTLFIHHSNNNIIIP